MRRLPILLAFALVFVLLVFAPVSAGKPDCDPQSPGYTEDHSACNTTETTTTTTTTPSVEVCVFTDGVLQHWDRGVLQLWNGSERLQCQWTIPDHERDMTFNFTLNAATDDGKTVNAPHLIVTDRYPNGGQICFNEYVNGWNDLPYSWSSFTLPANGLCDGGGGSFLDGEPDVFAITIDVIKVKKGPVELTYTAE